MNTARNAEPIIAARRKGLKPAGPVLVCLTSMYRPLKGDAIVYAKQDESYDWSWTKGLTSVVVLVDASTKLGSLLSDIEAHKPEQIDIVDVEKRRGWMLLSASHLVSIDWDQALVEDWLGYGDWHRELQQIKADGIKRVAAERPKWN